MTRSSLALRSCRVLVLFALPLAGCGQTAADPGQRGDAEQPLDEERGDADGKQDEAKGFDERREEIRALASQNTSCAANEDCTALAFGRKACGGPWEYLVVSTTGAGAAELESSVTAFNEDEATYNRENEVVSDCALLMEPAVHCDAGACAVAP